MTNLLYSLFLSMTANLDNILVGVTLGNRKRISLKNVGIILGINILVTVISLFFGDGIFRFIPEYISNILSASILVIFGIIGLVCKDTNDSLENNENGVELGIKETLLIGFSLSLNNFGIIAASRILSVAKISTILFNALFSGLFLILGSYISKKINGKIIKNITGILLIVLGIIEYIF